MILRPILQPVLQPVLRSPFDRRPTALTISQLLPSGAGRVAAIYSDPARPSYDECIQKNMEARGPELVSNGTFTDGTTGWTAAGNSSLSVVGGELEVSASGGAYPACRQDITCVTGRTYQVTATARRGTTTSSAAVVVQNSKGVLASTVYANTTTTNQTFTFVFRATDTTHRVVLFMTNNPASGTAYFDNISVREIDLSKCVLFSDAAGQTPVVYPIAAGQGKGLLLDRSAGLVRGVELAVNGGFDTDTDWTKGAGWAIGSGVATKTAGTASTLTPSVALTPTVGKVYEVVYTITRTAGSATVSIGAAAGAAKTASGTYTEKLLATTTGNLTISADAAFEGTIDNISVREIPGHHQQQPTAAARGEFSRRYNQLLATATLSTQSITAIATQYRLYFTGAGTVTLSGAATGTYSAGSHTITCTAGSLTLTVAGEVLTGDLRFEADATIGLPEYQRVTTASDYDEVGFPTYWRAQTDDWAKSHMDPNGATKVYVFWAGQKMSDAAGAMVLEHGNAGSINGSMYLIAPGSAGQPQYGVSSRGTITRSVQDTNGDNAAPSRSVVVTDTDIPNDIAGLTVNSRARVSITADQGTGTYTEQDVFFGARGGASLFANIREYAPSTILFLQPADSLSASHLSKLQRGYAKAVGVPL